LLGMNEELPVQYFALDLSRLLPILFEASDGQLVEMRRIATM